MEKRKADQEINNDAAKMAKRALHRDRRREAREAATPLPPPPPPPSPHDQSVTAVTTALQRVKIREKYKKPSGAQRRKAGYWRPRRGFETPKELVEAWDKEIAERGEKKGEVEGGEDVEMEDVCGGGVGGAGVGRGGEGDDGGEGGGEAGAGGGDAIAA